MAQNAHLQFFIYKIRGEFIANYLLLDNIYFRYILICAIFTFRHLNLRHATCQTIEVS